MSEPTAHGKSTKRLPKATKELAHSLYLQGGSPGSIAKHLGIEVGTVRTWTKRYGWRDNRAISREIMSQTAEGGEDNAPDTVASITVVQTKPTEQTEVSQRVREQLIEELEAQLAILRGTPIPNVAALATRRGEQGRMAVLKGIAETAATVFPEWETASQGIIIMGELRGSRDAIEPVGPPPNALPQPENQTESCVDHGISGSASENSGNSSPSGGGQ